MPCGWAVLGPCLFSKKCICVFSSILGFNLHVHVESALNYLLQIPEMLLLYDFGF